jgi:hypothetical protein
LFSLDHVRHVNTEMKTRQITIIAIALLTASGGITAQSIDPSAVTYKIAEGGTTRLFDIIIPPKFATEAGLIAVAKRLYKDTAALPLVAVEIYDNAKAELLVTTGKIDESNQAFCERHELASYERNLNANINRLRLYETVTKGAKKEISFANGEPTGGIFSHQTPRP